MNNNRKCIACGKEYEYCNSCAGEKRKPAWMSLWCEENCKNVFTIVSDYAQNAITKDEARAKLMECNYSQNKNFTSKINGYLDEIFKEDTVVISRKKTDKTDKADTTAVVSE